MKVRHVLDRLSQSLQTGGFRGTVRKLLDRYGKWATHRWDHIFYVDMPKNTDPGTRLGGEGNPSLRKVTGKEGLGRDEEEDLRRMRIPCVLLGQITERFARGATLWLWKRDGQVVGKMWSVPEKPPERFFLPLSPADAYLFDAEVSKDSRGKGVLQPFLAGVVDGLAAEGHRRAYLCISDWNTASLRAVAKTPFRRFGKARRFNVGQYDIVIWSEMAHRMTAASSRAIPPHVMKGRHLLVRLFDSLHSRGLYGTVRKFGDKAGRWWSHRWDHIFYLDLPGPLEPGIMRGSGQNALLRKAPGWEGLTTREEEDLRRSRNPRILLEEMTERFSKDAILWMWKQDGRVVGSVWSIRETPPERFFFPLSPEDAYLFDGEISADVRGQGIFMSLLHAVAEGIWLEGCRRIYFCVSDWNRSSLRAVGKTWYRRFGKARHIPLGRYDVVIWAEMAHRRAEEMP